jgi:hypothetical protein
MNLEDRGDEIRNKLRALGTLSFKPSKMSSMDKDFQTKTIVENADTKIRIMIATVADIPKVVSFFTEATHIQPPCVVFLEGYGEILEAVVNDNRGKFKQKVFHLTEDLKKLETDSIYFCDARKMMKSLQLNNSSKQASIMCFGIISRWMSQEIGAWRTNQILVEDFGNEENIRHPLYLKASDISPVTSFYYLSNRYLGKK